MTLTRTRSKPRSVFEGCAVAADYVDAAVPAATAPRASSRNTPEPPMVRSLKLGTGSPGTSKLTPENAYS
jgi:hypothetical protein